MNKGTLSPEMLTFGPGGELFTVDLTGGAFANGANLIFSVVPSPGGDGKLNVGAIVATNISLGKVTVTGNLGKIIVGNGDTTKFAIKSLTVGSLGRLDTAMQPPVTADPFASEIKGKLAKLIVQGNINFATVDVTGNVGTLNVGGDIIGSNAFTDVQIAALSTMGYQAVAGLNESPPMANAGLKTNGSLGSANTGALLKAYMKAGKDIGKVSIKSANSALIAAGGVVGKTLVREGITSDDPNKPSVFAAGESFRSITIKGDVRNALILVGYDKDTFAAKNADAQVGTVKVTGSWKASSLVVGVADITHDGFGKNDRPILGGTDNPAILSKIVSVIIKGTAEGSPDGSDSFGITAQSIGTVKYKGAKITATDKNAAFSIAITDDFFVSQVVSLPPEN